MTLIDCPHCMRRTPSSAIGVSIAEHWRRSAPIAADPGGVRGATVSLPTSPAATAAAATAAVGRAREAIVFGGRPIRRPRYQRLSSDAAGLCTELAIPQLPRLSIMSTRKHRRRPYRFAPCLERLERAVPGDSVT